MKIDLSTYKTTAEKIAYLVANKRQLVELKRAQIKFADAFGVSVFENNVSKVLNSSFTDDLESGIIKRTIIANTYYWLDSHKDVHIEGVFTKSIKERGDKIFHLHDHEFKTTAQVGNFDKVYEKATLWTDLGVNKAGSTITLRGDSAIEKELNPVVYKRYLTNKADQHSVGMIYVIIDLAVNDKDYKEEFAVWNKYIHLLGNAEEAEKDGFFWAVKEAKLIEISTVLAGSNELTPTVQNQQPGNKSTVSEPENKQLDYSKILSHISLS